MLEYEDEKRELNAEKVGDEETSDKGDKSTECDDCKEIVCSELPQFHASYDVMPEEEKRNHAKDESNNDFKDPDDSTESLAEDHAKDRIESEDPVKKDFKAENPETKHSKIMLWDPGIKILMMKLSNDKDVKDLELKILNKVIFSDSSNFESSRKMDAQGNPTSNILEVHTCDGCPTRNSNEGPYKWEHEHNHNPGFPALQKEDRRRIARWARNFTIYTGCPRCLETLHNVIQSMMTH